MNDLVFTFYDKENNLKHTFTFRKEWPGYIDIITHKSYGGTAWMHRIKDHKIIWRSDDVLELSEEAKTYISKIVKLLVFI